MTVWTIRPWRGEAGSTSMTASPSGAEESGRSIRVYAYFSGAACMASFGVAWNVGSGRMVIVSSLAFSDLAPTRSET
jgi:hypothetical protein